MKLRFLLAVFAAMIALAACVLETPVPDASPTPAPTGNPDVVPTEVPVGTSVVGPTEEAGTESGSGPVKQFVVMGGVRIPQYATVPPVSIDPTARYTAIIRTNLGDMDIELFPAQAPVAVNNFIFLANDGFYNGVIFHRVIPSFMIQGGDPTGTGSGGPGYKFQDEFGGGLTFDQPGRLAMANAGPGTNGSQFFVTTVSTPHLNGAHTIFGQVTRGQGVADAISLVETAAQNKPVTPIVIKGIDISKNP